MRRRFDLLAILLAFAALAFTATTAAGTPGQARAATAGGFDYLVFETGGARADAELPLIIGLHYSGGTPEETAGYFDGVDFPARIVLPRGPHPRPSGHSWLARQAGTPDLDAQAVALAAMADRLATFAAELRPAHPTRGKPIVVGVSYGGDLAFLLALRHPDAFAATFPVAARLLPEWMPANSPCANGCPSIHALHGTADAIVPMAPTSKAVARLATLGYDARMSAYPGIAHDFDARMQRDFAGLAARHAGKAD